MKSDSYMVLSFFIDYLLAKGMITEKEANAAKQQLFVTKDSTMQPITLVA